MKECIRIGAGQGFWGDWLEAPKHQVRKGPIDYLMMDYLAEVTMSIMMKQKLKDPKRGYATDFVDLMGELLPDLVSRNVKVLANAGGVNPRACAEAVRSHAKRLGLDRKVRIAIVEGDDILPRLDELISSGEPLANMESKDPLRAIKDKVLSANVYFGAAPLVEALKLGANIIITGRVTDTGLTLAPMIHEFGWSFSDWDKLAAGTIAGHIIECGAQCTGGNCSAEWESIPNFAEIGFPIIEARPDASFVVTKHEGTGGRVDLRSVKEQLMYEIGDPRSYITPDCVADFTTIELAQDGPDRVAVRGIKGAPTTEFFKVSASYANGFKAVGTLVYSWPHAVKKAKAGGEILKARLKNLGLSFDEVLVEIVGVNACHGPLTDGAYEDIPEVTLRVGVRGHDEDAIERFTREIAPLILTGPPSVTGFAGGRPQVQAIVSYWPALVSKVKVTPRVEVLE